MIFFFIWTESEEKLETFLKQLDAFHPALIFRHEKSKFSVNSLDAQVSSNNNEYKTNLYNNEFETDQLIVINFLSFVQRILFMLQGRLFIGRDCVLNGCVLHKRHLKDILKVYGNGLEKEAIPRN